MVEMIHLPKNVPEFCYRLIRGFLYAFTFILGVLGLSMVMFAFWYVYEGKAYHLDNSITFSIFSVSLVIGIVLFSVSACGLLGILKENLKLAKFFLLGMMILMIIEFSSIFLIYAYKKQILMNANSIFKNFISDYADDDDVRLFVDSVQSSLKCCGISSPNDWDLNPYYKCSSVSSMSCSVPPSCCHNFTMENQPHFNLFCGIGIRKRESLNQLYHMAHVRGCKYAIYAFLEYKYKITAGIFIGILIPQLIGVVLIIIYILILNYLVDMDLADLHLKYIKRFGLQKSEIFIYSHSVPSFFTMSSSTDHEQQQASHQHPNPRSYSLNVFSQDHADSKASTSKSKSFDADPKSKPSKIYFHLQ